MTEFGQQPEQQKLVVWDTIESRNREVADHYRAPDGTHWYWFVNQKSEDGLRNSRLCEPARECIFGPHPNTSNKRALKIGENDD